MATTPTAHDTDFDSFWSFINADDRESLTVQESKNETAKDPNQEVETIKEPQKEPEMTDTESPELVEKEQSSKQDEIKNQRTGAETKNKVYDLSNAFKRLNNFESFGVQDDNDDEDITNYMKDAEDDIDKDIFGEIDKRDIDTENQTANKNYNSHDKPSHPEMTKVVETPAEDAKPGAWGFPQFDIWKAGTALVSLLGSVLLMSGVIDLFMAIANINRPSTIGN